MKFSRKIYKRAVSALLIAIAAITAILLAGDIFTLASDAGKDGVYEFWWGKELTGKADEHFGTFTMKAMGNPYLSNLSGEKFDFDEGTYYGNPQLGGIRMHLKNWDPVISYETKKSKGDKLNDEIEIRHHNYSNYSDDSQTYYILDNSGTYNEEQLWNDFVEYTENRCTENEAFWEKYKLNMSKEGFFGYGISQTVDWGALSGAQSIAKELNRYLVDFLAEKGAAAYNPNIGIDFSGMADRNEAYITVIRTGISKVELDYTVYEDGSENYWVEQYIPFLMFSVSNYTVKFKMSLNEPIVEALGSAIEPVTDDQDVVNYIYKDESVRLNFSGNETISSKLQYCLFSSDYTISEVAGMDRFQEAAAGEYINLYGTGLSGDDRYLYVRTKLTDEVSYPKYRDSNIIKYKFKLDKIKADGTITLEVVSAVEAEPEAADVGDEVILKNSNDGAATFYTLDGTLPEFMLFMGEEGLSITTLEAAVNRENDTIYFLEFMPNYNYLKVNGFWYRCSKSVKKYNGPFTLGAEIRQQNRLLLRARSVESGFEFGEFQSAAKAYKLKHQVSAPVADIKTSEENPVQLEMGSKINFSSATAESEIFYTTNGSSPVVITGIDSAGNTVTQPGNEATRKYDIRTAITITDKIASYGSNLTFMVKAVSYDGIYRTMKDSDVVKFIYKIAEQPVVEPVSAIPATSSLSPATVMSGDKIMLYSKTQGVTIYYTTDGTEPVRKEDGTLGESTKKYDASKGVTVPAQKNETLFTITAMGYADGYAVSEVARLVYKYPDAIAPPYATPGSGVVNEYTSVELKSSAEGAVIYYELATGNDKPKDPSLNSKVFDTSNPIVITAKTTIKAIAVCNGISSAVSTFNYRISGKLSAPTASIQNGSVIASGTSLTLTADEGAAVHYTTDGSNPSDSANTNVNIGSFLLLEGEPGSIITIRTYASKEGFSDSETATYSYSFSYYGEAVFADKESGTVVKNGEIIKLNTDVSGGVIYYTTDGSMPSASSNQGNTVVIQGEAGSNVTVKAIVMIPGNTQTAAAAVFTYTIMDKLKAPESNVPSNAIFTEEGQVILSAPAGTIYYTTDGTQPTRGSSVYKDSIRVNRDMTIRAVAISEDADTSDVSIFVYSFAGQVEMPVASHDSGELEMDAEIELQCATPGASIYYTINGTDPNLDDMESLKTYTGPIKVDSAMTLKAIASKTGMRESKVLTVGYTVREQAHNEERTENVQSQVESSSGRLMSRRTFSGENQGPSFDDIVLKNSTYGVIVASPFDVIPDDTKLNVSSSNASQSGQNMVKQYLGEHYALVSSFDIGLEVEGEEIQPDGEIELGIPIEPEFENAIIYVVYVGDDGTIEVQDTRRSGGMAYAMVSHLSQYSIVASKINEDEKKNLIPMVFAGTGVAAVIAGFIAFAVVRRRKYYDR